MVKPGNTNETKKDNEPQDCEMNAVSVRSGTLRVWRSVYATLFLINFGILIVAISRPLEECSEITYVFVYHIMCTVLNAAIMCVISRNVNKSEDVFLKSFPAMRWVHMAWAITGIIAFGLLHGSAVDGNFCLNVLMVSMLVYGIVTVCIVMLGYLITKCCF